MFEELTSSPIGDMFLDPSLTAYIKAKNIFFVDDVPINNSKPITDSLCGKKC